MNQIGFTIKTLRKAKGLTQEEVCCDILSRSSLSKIENNLMDPSLTQLMHIASVLNVDAAAILNPPENPGSLYMNENNKSHPMEDLYNNERYLTLIELTEPVSFQTMFYKGMSYYKLGMNEKSMNYLSQCENLFLKLDDKEKKLQCENLCSALNIYRVLKVNFCQGENNFKFLNKILNYISLYHCENKEIYPKIVNNLAVYYLQTGDPVTASNLIEEYLNTKKDSCFIKVSALLHVNISIAKFCLFKYNESLAHIKKAIFFFDYCHEKYKSDECYIQLFNNLLYMKNFHEAFRLVEFLKEYLKNSYLRNTFALLKAILFYNLGDMGKTWHILNLINPSSLRDSSLTDYIFLHGRVSFSKGHYDTCESDFERCINILREDKRYLDLSMVYKDLHGIHKSEEYNSNYNKYVSLHNNRKYNHLSPDITVI